MRSSCIFLVIICLTGALKANDNFSNKLTALLTMKTQAAGAIDTVLKLLHDLRQANVKEQKAADAQNVTDEREGRAQIANLTAIRDANLQILNDAKAHTLFIETELNDTIAYIDWIHKRKQEIHDKLADLADQRCYANAMFVKALKEHMDGLRVIRLLRHDLAGFTSTGEISLDQIKDISSKLSVYTHLFNQQAMKEFLQLTREGYEDNSRGELKVKEFETNISGRNISAGLGDTLDAMLKRLEEHLEESMKNLEANEIRAAFDLAEFQAKSEAENRTLNAELVRKTTYQKKLEIDLDVAQQVQAKAQRHYDDSCRALQQAIDELNAKRAHYAAETARRNHENEVLDGVIKMFEERVNGIAQYLKDRVDDYNEDEKFNKTDLRSRSTDEQVAKDQGKVAHNVAKEAEKTAPAPGF